MILDLEASSHRQLTHDATDEGYHHHRHYATLADEPSTSPSRAPSRVPSRVPTRTPTRAPTSTPSVLGPNNNFCAKTNFLPVTPTKSGMCSVYNELRAAFNAAIPSTIRARASLFGAAVRLVFHDAGEVDLRFGGDRLGPDGCLSHEGDSAGLTEATSLVNTVIEPLWQQMCDRISRADFWVLFGKLVVEAATAPATTGAAVSVAFQYGRRDNVECEGGAGRLPSAQGDLAEIRRVFLTQMGLTLNDAVTLLGAHSLGHVHISHSGYGFYNNVSSSDQGFTETVNAWDNTPDTLDNDYFIKLTDKVSFLFLF